MSKDVCVIEVGHPAGTPARWRNAALSEHMVCDRHRHQYETSVDPANHNIKWLSINYKEGSDA